MFFTQEDFKRIEAYLTSNAVKDTQFDMATLPFSEAELVPIIQNNRNVLAPIKAFLNDKEEIKSDLLNVSEKYGEYNITLSQAINLVPEIDKKQGMIITFNVSQELWGIYQFIGSSTAYWSDTTKWKDIGEYITLYADEEDLTEVEEGDKKVLKFKDKEYDTSLHSGKGRVYLRKSIVGPMNWLDVSKVNKPNTIYHIQYDFNLNGQTWEIPEGCILLFEGGSLTNGGIKGNDTIIASKEYYILKNITIQGTWNIPTVYSKWVFDTNPSYIDFRNLMAFAGNNTVKISGGELNITWPANASLMKVPSNTILDFTNTSINLDPSIGAYKSCIEIANVSNVKICNLKLTGNYTNNPSSQENSTGVWIESSSDVVLEDCIINKFPRFSIYLTGTSEIPSANISINRFLSTGSVSGIGVKQIGDVYISNSTIEVPSDSSANLGVGSINEPPIGNSGRLIISDSYIKGNIAVQADSVVPEKVQISNSNIVGKTIIISCNDVSFSDSIFDSIQILTSKGSMHDSNIKGGLVLNTASTVVVSSCTMNPVSYNNLDEISSLIHVYPAEGSGNLRFMGCFIKMPDDAPEEYTIISRASGDSSVFPGFYNCTLIDERQTSHLRLDYADYYKCNIKVGNFLYSTTANRVSVIESCYIENSTVESVEFLNITATPPNSLAFNISGNEILYPVKDEFIKISSGVDVSGSGFIFKNNSIPFEEVNKILDKISLFKNPIFYNQPSYSKRLYGSTTEMPILSPKEVGYKYFDINTGLSLTWDGTGWINPDGTKVSKVVFV